MRGRILYVMGPSGSGKDSLIATALATRPELRHARRVVTRPPAPGETDHSVSVYQWQHLFIAGHFALWWTAHECAYGIPRRPLQSWLDAGRDVLISGSRAAWHRVVQAEPTAVGILVQVDPERLRARLAGRKREDALQQEMRLERAVLVPAVAGYHLVRNDGSLAEAVAALAQAVGWPVSSQEQTCLP